MSQCSILSFVSDVKRTGREIIIAGQRVNLPDPPIRGDKGEDWTCYGIDIDGTVTVFTKWPSATRIEWVCGGECKSIGSAIYLGDWKTSLTPILKRDIIESAS